MPRRHIRSAWAAALVFGAALPAAALHAQETEPAPGDVAGGEAQEPLQLTAAEMFALGDAARDRGDYETAEAVYRALTQDPNPELRTEARFRLGKMFTDNLGRHRDAAVLFREILDEKPDAAAVRLELARMQALLGNLGEARRELRAAQASGLPPEVEQMVRFYANALTAQKRTGGSIEVAIAPSTNINSATSSDTLGTIIGDFILDEDAQAKSGVGLSLKGQAYHRLPLSMKTDLLLRASTSADLYRDMDFSDLAASVQAGPQWRWGSDRFSLAGTATWRWYGLDPYSFSYGATGNWQHPLSQRTQMRIDGSVLVEDNKRNNAQDGERYVLAAGVDHAFTPRFGGGVQVNGSRFAAADPGYATASGGLRAYLFREIGQTTAVLNLGYDHLEADKRLFLYPERRKDDHYSVAVSGTFRQLRIGTLAPIARVRYDRNVSTVEIYDYDRWGFELGLTAAF